MENEIEILKSVRIISEVAGGTIEIIEESEGEFTIELFGDDDQRFTMNDKEFCAFIEECKKIRS